MPCTRLHGALCCQYEPLAHPQLARLRQRTVEEPESSHRSPSRPPPRPRVLVSVCLPPRPRALVPHRRLCGSKSWPRWRAARPTTTASWRACSRRPTPRSGALAPPGPCPRAQPPRRGRARREGQAGRRRGRGRCCSRAGSGSRAAARRTSAAARRSSPRARSPRRRESSRPHPLALAFKRSPTVRCGAVLTHIRGAMLDASGRARASSIEHRAERPPRTRRPGHSHSTRHRVRCRKRRRPKAAATRDSHCAVLLLASRQQRAPSCAFDPRLGLPLTVRSGIGAGSCSPGTRTSAAGTAPSPLASRTTRICRPEPPHPACDRSEVIQKVVILVRNNTVLWHSTNATELCRFVPGSAVGFLTAPVRTCTKPGAMCLPAWWLCGFLCW